MFLLSLAIVLALAGSLNGCLGEYFSGVLPSTVEYRSARTLAAGLRRTTWRTTCRAKKS